MYKGVYDKSTYTHAYVYVYVCKFIWVHVYT